MTKMKSPYNIGFVTFGDGSPNWRITAKRLKKLALTSNLFCRVSALQLEDLNFFLTKDEKQWMRKTRGFGYWLWKSMAILKFASENQSLDLILYMDAGCHINLNPEALQKFEEYCNLAKHNGILAFRTQHLERDWSKNDLLNLFETDYSMSGQFLGAILMGTPEKISELARHWLELSRVQSYHFLDDSPSLIPNYIGFKEHRHDQSILSLLLKERSIAEALESEVYFESWDNGKKYPFWTTRHVSYIPFEDRYKPKWRTRLIQFILSKFL